MRHPFKHPVVIVLWEASSMSIPDCRGFAGGLLLMGCQVTAADTVMSSVEDLTADLAALERFDASIERGDLEVRSAADPAWMVRSRREATGRTEGQATRRNDADPVAIAIVFDTLRVTGAASHPSRRTDVTFDGPEDIDVTADVTQGQVRVIETNGDHDIIAERVEIEGGTGDRTVRTTADGAEIDGRPAPGDTWRLDITGDLVLTLPADVEVRLQAVLSEGARAEVTGFRFDDYFATDDLIEARSGSGAVDMAIDVRRGVFTLAVAEL